MIKFVPAEIEHVVIKQGFFTFEAAICFCLISIAAKVIHFGAVPAAVSCNLRRSPEPPARTGPGRASLGKPD